MRYEHLKRYSDTEFKRLVGVPRELFSEMVSVIHDAELQKRRPGRRHSLSLEDQLLLTLNYLRLYTTQLSLSASYGIAESNVNRTIHKIENILVKSRRFALSKKAMVTEDEDFNWVILDCTETEIERPKKSSGDTIAEKRKNIP